MSIIQQIREKAAWLVFGIIALSLLGFLLMDAFVGGGGRGLFGGNETTVGSVNGTKIEYVEYQTRLKAMEDQYAAQGYPMNEMMRQNLQSQVWEQFIQQELLKEQAAKLGLSVSSKELDDILFGANPPQDIRQQFTAADGSYDANAAKAAIQALRKKKGDPMAERFSSEYLPALMEGRLQEKYVSLLSNSTYVPKWMVEKMNTDNSEMASINFVNTPYSTISDSTVSINDAEIEAYVKKHPEEYKQEENRGISYVSFSAAPTAADSSALLEQIRNLKTEFATTTDANAFLVRNGTETNFFDGYTAKTNMKMPNADSIRALADGAIYGPYLDGGNYVLAKMIGKRVLPDSVKVRHILISNRTTPDSIASKRMDSIVTAIKGGAPFELLCQQYSEDPGSKDKGGEYEFSSQQFGQLARPFAEAIFYGVAGDKKTVQTDFGYHYIEVLSQKNFQPAYKVAYLSKAIMASQETENAASGLANQFAGESRNAKAFEENIKKKNYNKLIAGDIKPNDNTVTGIGSNRSLVRWIYEASRGDVSEPYNVDDKYVVVMVTDINKEGTMSAQRARPLVEFILRNQKKAETIKKKIGSASTLEAVAAATGQTVLQADSVSFGSPFIPNVGHESKVIGACFDKNNKGKVSAPIAGNGGVFVVKVNNVYAQPTSGTPVQQQQLAMQQQMRSAATRSIESLKKTATIKDKRAKLF